MPDFLMRTLGMNYLIVKWCPCEDFLNFCAVGLYQLDEQATDDAIATQRRIGCVQLYKLAETCDR